MNENVMNGLPDPSPKPFKSFNGLESSHSSRGSSPSSVTRVVGQLPPIPAGQLPPSRNLNVINTQMTRMSLSKPIEVTPQSSPKIFTSTPILEPPKSAFTHSSTSQFTAVKKEPDDRKVSSFFSGGDAQVGLFREANVNGSEKPNLNRESQNSKVSPQNPQPSEQRQFEYKPESVGFQTPQNVNLLSNQRTPDNLGMQPVQQIQFFKGQSIQNQANLMVNQTNFQPQNQGLIKSQDEGMIQPQNQGIIKPQYQGMVKSQDLGMTQPQKQGMVKPHDQGIVKPQDQGMAKQQDQGMIQSQSQGMVKPQDLGMTQPQNQGMVKPHDQGIVKAQDQGMVKLQDQGMIQPQNQGMIQPQNQVMIQSQSQGTIQSQSQGTIHSQSQGTIQSQYQGTTQPQNQAMNKTQSQAMIQPPNQAMIQSQNQIKPQNQGLIQSQNHALYQQQNLGMNQVQSQAMIKPQNQGMIQPQIQGMIQPQNQGMIKPQNPGMSQPQNQGMIQPQNQTIQSPSQGMFQPQNQGMIQSQNRGMIQPQNQGMFQPQIRPATLQPTQVNRSTVQPQVSQAMIQPQVSQSMMQPQISQPMIQPHLQQYQQQQQQVRIPPKSNSFPTDQNKAPIHSNRYPQLQQQQQQQQQLPQPRHDQLNNYQQQNAAYQASNVPRSFPSVSQSGFNKLWGTENFDLLQCPNVLPPTKLHPPKIELGQDFLNAANCSPDIFRCTMTKIPESTALLQKSRLPLGVLIHPFKDLSNLPVVQCNTIVRCRTCRTYINPFVYFVDSKRWKCNLCYRVNELPEEFQYDPVSKTYGDPSRRPEVRSSTIEYIAPAEYMLRPPQPAIYLYLFDVSRLAVESGYLQTVCNVLTTEINNIPGDARTQIGFLCYDSSLHFYSLSEGQNQPHEMTVLEVDDVFVPCPDNLLVNLHDRIELILDLLSQLPSRFAHTYDTNSALGAALQAAYKMTSPTGGRITVFQSILPNKGPGAVTSREDPNQRSSSDVHHLNPANDFYKRLALECSGQQVAVDLFVLNSQYVDLATISGISRFSGGCIYHFPLFKFDRVIQNDHFERAFRRYITRKIGFEAVMRIRCTRGLSIHTFHGNFFVRSTDLLSLPNINPDAGFGMQVAIEENLSDVQTVCFQAALLYTSSKGERRIRVHTLCLPIANNLHDILNSADQQCIVGLLSKMAVDRSMQSSLLDAREAFLNVAIDILTSYKMSLNMGSGISGLMASNCLRLLPLYISAILKSVAFRIGTSTRLDDRVKALCDMKTKPLQHLIQQIYPDLFPVHNLEDYGTILNEDEEQIHLPPHLQLTARNLDSNGAYLMDIGENMVLFVCSNVTWTFLSEVLDTHEYNALREDLYELPNLNNPSSRRMQAFVNYLNDDKPFPATFQVIKENSPNRIVFLERLIEDRLENSLSYHEFLQHIKSQVK